MNLNPSENAKMNWQALIDFIQAAIEADICEEGDEELDSALILLQALNDNRVTIQPKS